MVELSVEEGTRVTAVVETESESGGARADWFEVAVGTGGVVAERTTNLTVQDVAVRPASKGEAAWAMGDYDAQLDLGLSLLEQSRHAEAIAAFELCHAMRPSAPLPAYYLAGCLAQMSDVSRGVR